MNRPKLTLPGKHATMVANEERLMRSTAGELDVPVKEVSEPALTPAEAPRAAETLEAPLNTKEPYACVCGVPGAAFVQGKKYFDRAMRYAGRAPETAWYFVEPIAAPTKEQMRAAAARVVMEFSDVPRVPRSVVDAEKENARAFAAENLAE